MWSCLFSELLIGLTLEQPRPSGGLLAPAPLPLADLWHVFAIFGYVLFVLDAFVAENLLGIVALGPVQGNPIDDVENETVTGAKEGELEGRESAIDHQNRAGTELLSQKATAE